jgi:hypothetical protein
MYVYMPSVDSTSSEAIYTCICMCICIWKQNNTNERPSSWAHTHTYIYTYIESSTTYFVLYSIRQNNSVCILCFWRRIVAMWRQKFQNRNFKHTSSADNMWFFFFWAQNRGYVAPKISSWLRCGYCVLQVCSPSRAASIICMASFMYGCVCHVYACERGTGGVRKTYPAVMYVCVCVYIYIYIYICHVCVCVCVFVCM